ncbi:MAG: hypothetical protein B7Y61_01030 [Rhizobiales bacterium 35-66-30]|nr:MAG: hypothetical protein B7Y61_01030 [Rhizobiales bacterium 35-66-30]
MAALTVHVPRGHAGIWSIIKRLDILGPWSVREVSDQTNARKDVVADYVRRLAKAGITVPAGERENPGSPVILHRLTRRPTDAPRLRRDGTECLPTGQEQMWRAMRVLGTFGIPELAHAASTDLVPVNPVAAEHYVKHLAHAGYLHCVEEKHRISASTWRLKPSANTGPLPPLVMRTKFVWDQNQRVVKGDPENAGEVAA